MNIPVKLFIGTKRQVAVCKTGRQFSRKLIQDPRYGSSWSKWIENKYPINDLAEKCWLIDEIVWEVKENSPIKKYQKYWKNGRIMVRP